MKKKPISLLLFFFPYFAFSSCDSSFTYFSELPNNVTILVGDTCLSNSDIDVLDSLISQNALEYNSPLELGTQTWFNGRLRFLVAGNYGNSSGVNDTIYSLPDNFGDLTSLASLYLEWNRISVLPQSFSELSSLASVYLNNNIITSLGDSIGNLTNLFFLDVGYNELEFIPESICSLVNLSYFWLFNNNLTSLPDCFCGMELDWINDDDGGYPFFAMGANNLCDNIPACVMNTEHFELSLDQFYYSFPVFSPQECDTVTTSISNVIFPYQFNISSPYPNPFNPSVNLDLNIPYDRRMMIEILDLKGKRIDIISDGNIYKKGKNYITWHSKNNPSGIYFFKLQDNNQTLVKKVILIK